MRIKMKRFLGILLSFALVLGLMPGMSLTAYAATLTSESTVWSENSVIAGDVTINNNVTVNADITLTIPEGKILTINGQSDYSDAVIYCDNNSILTVSGGGTLIVNAPAEEVGHSPIDGFLGNLIVDGATVQVTGEADGVYGNVTVNSGSVCVNGGNGEAGGEGYSGIAGVVIVNGGSITVVGGNGGNGYNYDDGGNGGYGVCGGIIFNGGSATITGGNGGTKGDAYASDGYFGQAVYGSITGNAEESEDDTNWTSVTGNTSSKQYIKAVASYPLWVGGVQVTSANKDDPGSRGWSYTPATTGENPTPAKLTLNNYTYKGEGYNNAAIYANENLTIESKGTNTITQTGSTDSSYGILVISGNSLTITGSGSLTSNAGAAAGENSSEGIFVGNQLIIEKDTTVTATGGKYTGQIGESYGVRALDGLTVNGSLTASGSSEVSNSYGVSTYGTMDVGETGTVNATGNYGVVSFNNMTISGSVTTADTGLYGILSYGDVTINSDVTAAGSEQAIYGTVKNSIAGTGWTDTEDTTGKASIAVSEAGQELNSYKKVQFPAVPDPVAYIDHNATTGTAETKACTNYTAFVEGTNDTLTTIPEGWYVIVSGNAVATNRLVVNGAVNLILCDGATLIARKGITVTSGNTLNIYAGSMDETILGTGKLYAGTTNGTISTCEQECAGIGGNVGTGGGKVTIHGGEVTALGYTKGAGIGGGSGGAGGTVTIYGGTVTTSGGVQGKGIGAGHNGTGNGKLTLGTGMYLYGGTSANPENDPSNHVAKAENDYARSQYMTVNNSSPHSHDFTYTENGAVITATCSNSDQEHIGDTTSTLTIVKPALTTYGGTGSETATLSGLAAFNSATGLSVEATDIKYVGREGTSYNDSATAPTNAGKYTAKITITGVKTSEGDDKSVTACVDYEIFRIAPAANDFTYTAPSDLAYDGTAKTANVLPNEGIAGMGAVTVKYYSDAACSTEAEPVNVGTYYVGITVTEGNNYNATTAVLHGEDWKFTIGKINPTANDFVFTAPSDLNYDGTAKSATVTAASSATGMGAVTVKYYSDASCSTEAEPVNVGTYYVGITVTEGDNYNAAAAVLHGEDWKFTIGKINPATGDFTYTAPSDLDYDGTAKSATVTAASSVTGMGAVTAKYYSDAACSTEAEPLNAGTYYVGITVTEGDNYNATTAVLHGEDWKFTIGKINPVESDFTFAVPTDLDYDGNVKSATVTAASSATGMGAVTVKYYSDVACSTEAEPVNVGTYYVGITVTEGNNYNATTAVLHGEDWKFTIGKINPNVNDFVFTAPTDLDYDGNVKSATVTAASSATGMGAVTVKYYSNASCSTEAEPVNVGTYYVGITVTEGNNYNAAATVLHGEDWKFTIGKINPAAGDFTYTAPSDLDYDGTAKSATVTAAEGTAGMGAVTVKYYSDASCSTEAEPVKAGTYYVGITVTEGDNYNAAAAVLHGEDWKFTIGKINPAASDFTYAAPADLDYDGTAKSATVTAAEGIAGMGAVTVKYYSDASCSTEAEPVNVGTYYVGITVTEGDNYNATTAVLHGEDWKFTIGKINPNANDFVFTAPSDLNYDGTAKSATVTAVSSAKGMGAVAVKYYSDAACTDEVENPKNVGTYYVGITVTEGDNYDAITSVLHDDNWQFTIGKASATVTETPTAKTLTYTGTVQELVTAGEADGGRMYYAVTTENKAPTDESLYTTDIPTGTEVGTYYVWYKVVGDANHFDSEAKCIKSIIKEQPKEEPKEEPKDEPKETPKDVDVTPEVEETTEDNSSEEVPTETQSPYRTEWVDGQWYDSEGNATYKPQGKWYQDSTGWWYQDTSDWYPSSQWQKIDGKWYYFTSDGYMDYSEYRDGFWLGSDGAWVETYYGGGWGEKYGQFWYEDATGWYPVSQWLWINGKCYYFRYDGYRVYNQYVGGYWVNNDGEWEP